MTQGQSNTDLRTNTLKILARIMAKDVLQKSETDKGLSKVELPPSDTQVEDSSVSDTDKR